MEQTGEAIPRDAPPPMPVRRLHNYVYCPRLFYLQWVEDLFVDNADTVAGSYVHRGVDRPSPQGEGVTLDLPPGARVRSLKMESETLGIVGVVDLIEDHDGVTRLTDYKKGRCGRDESGNPIVKESDAVQVLAHALLLEEHGRLPDTASVYYAEEKRHLPVELTPANLNWCRSTIETARETAQSGQCPPPLRDDVRCLYCSAYPICLPNESVWWQNPDGEEPPEIATPPRPDNDEADLLIVQQGGAAVGLRAGKFTVTFKGEKLHEVPAQQTRAIYLYGAVQLTAAAAQHCLEHSVDVAYFSPAGRFLGLLRGLPTSGIDARLGQYRVYENMSMRLRLAREFIRAKIHNQRVMLMRNGEAASTTLDELEKLREQTADAENLTALMGMEGRAAALYFGAFKTMLRTDLPFDFDRRNRRPPRDPVNALLSLAYSVLSKELTGVCHTVGLDPFVGFLHAPRYGRPAMALDLMEEFRPLIADSVVISLLNRLELHRDDFVFTSKGVFLDDGGRRAFWQAYARRMDTEVRHPAFGYRMAYRRMLEVQCRQVWRFLRGEAARYTGFTTR